MVFPSRPSSGCWEILIRYPSDHVVHESIQQAEPELLSIVDRADRA